MLLLEGVGYRYRYRYRGCTVTVTVSVGPAPVGAPQNFNNETKDLLTIVFQPIGEQASLFWRVSRHDGSQSQLLLTFS